MSTRIASFAPIASPNAQLLILGSMPGAASLAANQYYAHPRNAFWKIMGELLGFDAQQPYQDRVAALMNAGIAVWDVLRSCRRTGSLDNAIEFNSIEVNDFDAFFRAHSLIKVICFNGATAERCYRQQVQEWQRASISYFRLPSSSPAHAALSLAKKTATWRGIIAPNISSSKA